MADSRINFYFFLITHSAVGQLIQDQQARKIIEARFKLARIELEESTAFKLLGQAIRHEPDLAQEWDKIVDELWGGVKRGTVDVIKSKDISVKDSDFSSPPCILRFPFCAVLPFPFQYPANGAKSPVPKVRCRPRTSAKIY